MIIPGSVLWNLTVSHSVQNPKNFPSIFSTLHKQTEQSSCLDSLFLDSHNQDEWEFTQTKGEKTILESTLAYFIDIATVKIDLGK